MNQGIETGKPQPASGPHVPDRGAGAGQTLGSDILASLTGRDANRERAVALRTRRVVQSSLGVMREIKQDGNRMRSRALAIIVVVLLLIGPLLWEATDSLAAGEHLGDPGNQWSLWACIVCPTLLGAALVAGWWRKRS